MNKMKQIAALTAMLVGVIMYASPAKCAVCFLPDDDGSCGGGDIEISDGSGSDDSKPEEKCEGFTVSATNYDKMKDCFNFTYCTKSKTKEVVYKKGGKKSNTHWYPNWNACCTGGTAYDLREGKCCPAGGCVHDECDAPKVWSSILGNCVCPADREENTTSNTCCPVGEHADGAICCPDKKHNEGGVCKCDSQYNTDKNGNCVLPNNCTYAYRQATTEDSCGLTDLNTNFQCMESINGCMCYTQLQKVSSVDACGAGTVVPYNRISNKSATCVDKNNVTRYQTICQGTRKSTCSAYGKNYEFKPNGCVSDTYNNGFEVKGDEWGDCVKKDETCTYEYRRATTEDSDNITGDLDGGKKYPCQISTNCYKKLSQVKSIDIRGGTGNVMPIYDRISKASASCKTLDGVTKYQTICQGTAKDECKKSFTPNGCVSSGYNNGFKVLGTEWGTCGCDTSKGLYDTSDECREKTKYGCTLVSSCYRSCESLGYFTKREDCEANMPAGSRCLSPGAKEGNSNCYVRRKIGWGIYYGDNLAKENTRKYECKDDTYVTWNAMVSQKDKIDYTEDLNGIKYYKLSKDARYLAGEYRVCVDYGWDEYIVPTSIRLVEGNGFKFCEYSWTGSQWKADKNDFCSNSIVTVARGSRCVTATFRDGMEYSITAGFTSSANRYCHPIGSSHP